MKRKTFLTGITDEELFYSPFLVKEYEELAQALTGRADPRVIVKLIKSEIDAKTYIARTDGNLIQIHPYAERFAGLSRRERYGVLYGVVTHEIAHILYTDFSKHIFCHGGSGMYDTKRRIYGEAGVDVDDLGYYEKAWIVQIQNCIEDGYIENAFKSNFHGVPSAYLKKARAFLAKDYAPVPEELKGHGLSAPFVSNVTLMYATTGRLDFRGEPLDEALTDRLRTLMDIIDEAVVDTDQTGRWIAASKIYKLFEDVFQAAKEKGEEPSHDDRDVEENSMAKDPEKPKKVSDRRPKKRKEPPKKADGGKEKDDKDSEAKTPDSPKPDTSADTPDEKERDEKTSSPSEEKECGDKSEDHGDKKSDEPSEDHGDDKDDEIPEDHYDETDDETPDCPDDEEGEDAADDPETESGDDEADFDVSEDAEDGDEDGECESEGPSSSTSDDTSDEESEDSDTCSDDPGDAPVEDGEGTRSSSATPPEDEDDEFGPSDYEPDEDDEEDSEIFDDELIDEDMDESVSRVLKGIAEEKEEEEIAEERSLDAKGVSGELSGDFSLVPVNSKSWAESDYVSDYARSKYDNVMKDVGPVSKRLQRSLISEMQDREYGSKRSGLLVGKRFEARNAYRMDMRAFSTKTAPTELKSLAVAVLVDLSGSMSNGTRIPAAIKTSLLVQDFCSGLHYPVAVYGHASDYDGCNVFTFSEWSDKGRELIADMQPMWDNHDGHALRYVKKRLLRRPEPNKLLIYISDGEPCGCCFEGIHYRGPRAIDDLKRFLKEAKKDGVSLICAGIGDDRDALSAIYGDAFMDISDLSKLPVMIVRRLKRLIQQVE